MQDGDFLSENQLDRITDASVDRRRGGRDTTRVTVALQHEALTALETLSDELDATRRNILDQAIGLLRYFSSDEVGELNRLVPTEDGARRTLTLSRSKLTTLQRRALEAKLPRERLLSLGLLVLARVHSRSRDQLAKRRRVALREVLDPLADQAAQAEKRLRVLLGSEDAVLYRFGVVWVVLDNLISAINEELNGGDPVDPDDM